MVYGACWCPLSKIEALKKLGFADSKVLTDEKRRKLFEVIKASDYLGYLVDIIGPEDMSSKMLRRIRINLNEISHDSAIGLVQKALDQGVNVKQVFIDTVGSPEKYQEKMTYFFPEIEFTVSKKADSIYPIVSAASICAKVTRDNELENWVYKEKGLKFPDNTGSGYPGDAETKQWLNTVFEPVFGFPSLARFSWGTCNNMFKEKGKNVDWGEGEEEDDDKPNRYKKPDSLHSSNKQRKLNSFYTAKGSTAIPLAKRPRFYRERFMHVSSTV